MTNQRGRETKRKLPLGRCGSSRKAAPQAKAQGAVRSDADSKKVQVVDPELARKTRTMTVTRTVASVTTKGRYTASGFRQALRVHGVSRQARSAARCFLI